ncbi:hypothetical protein IE81DRAFT_89095 [Ceraceosorus guamensis]|uniref:Uncharacterized protein n=1 Tax=Ceraceosorus guamensis TaxID=1522189 RepID=A0A316W0L0_9BASI|nr:hypothetical protein IE81DRAFT_89095 [Ceraceosorus guamensis]PWN43386.1 hypothetical protein IE81DRAFT_89095 [Ceraceosorus guamensis]
MNRALGEQAARSVQDASQACLRRTVGTISPIQTRAFSSGSVSKKQCKALCAGISLAFLGGALASQTAPHVELAGKRLFGTSSSIFADEIKSASSSILRQASPAAARRPQTHLVFLTLDQAERDAWQQWIAYFRNEGFDCLLINAAVEGGEADHSRLGDAHCAGPGSKGRTGCIRALVERPQSLRFDDLPLRQEWARIVPEKHFRQSERGQAAVKAKVDSSQCQRG